MSASGLELELVAGLRRRLGDHPRLRLGPGDDAAILRLGDRAECVVTVDLLSDGVDFELSRVDPRRIGHKALAVNLSDLAAMASRPAGAVVALLLPRENTAELTHRLYDGLLPLAERFDMPIAGGDINTWDGPLVISITALGEVTSRGPLLRSGARPGDRLLVTGQLGGSILGKHLDFEPRIHEALWLAENATLHAGLDLSDGLGLDLWRLCQESGCGALIDFDGLPIAPAAHELSAQQRDGRTPRDHAWGDGEDFELLLALPEPEAQRLLAQQPLPCGLTSIGQVLAEPGLWRRDAQAPHGRVELPPSGYQHGGTA